MCLSPSPDYTNDENTRFSLVNILSRDIFKASDWLRVGVKIFQRKNVDQFKDLLLRCMLILCFLYILTHEAFEAYNLYHILLIESHLFISFYSFHSSCKKLEGNRVLDIDPNMFGILHFATY